MCEHFCQNIHSFNSTCLQHCGNVESHCRGQPNTGQCAVCCHCCVPWLSLVVHAWCPVLCSTTQQHPVALQPAAPIL